MSMPEPLPLLPWQRTWTDCGVVHVYSVIDEGFRAHQNGIEIVSCPYDYSDPDGRSWWKLGWLRRDSMEVKHGRASRLVD